MKLDIVARSGVLFDGEATSVVVPALDGELGILPGHTPLLAVLNPGTVRFTKADGTEGAFTTTRGFVTVDTDVVSIVVDSGRQFSSTDY